MRRNFDVLGLLSRDKYFYSPLQSSKTGGSRRTCSNYTLPTFLLGILGILCLIVASFMAGRHSVADNSLLTIPLGTTSEIFKYNRTFGSPPSNITNAAWAALFPEQGGFFKHPSIAPERSAFSVFHQLHCLDGIRQGYWAVYNAATSGKKISEEDFPFMSSPPHIRHCIDLLRHSLMCRPDTTVEIKDKEIGGVTGFGTEHRCRDWGELMAWTGRWEGWMQDPRHNESTHHTHHGR